MRSGTPPFAHYLAEEEPFAQALRVAASRLPRWLVREPAPPGAGEWDGRIEPDERIAPWIGNAEREPATVSPTSLEHYGECPYRFFLKHVLRIEEMAVPEEVLKLEAAERGNIMHDTLERFFTEARRHEPEEEWTDVERERLLAILDERFDETERAGLAGPQLMWESEKARIRRELNLFLSRDEEVRRATGARFQNAEKGFGRKVDEGDEPWAPAKVELGEGRRLSLSGQVDRVDTTVDGYAVYDYKSGGAYAFREIESAKVADPLVRGKKLQLPVYALAVRQSVEGAESARIEAKYWFINEQEGFRQIGYPLDEEHEQRFVEVLNVMTASVEAGQFPQTPSKKSGDQNSTPSNCKYCAFDRLCPSADRRERWELTMERPELAALAALIEGTDGSEGEGPSDE
jgi:RecB family exonuclease